MKSGATPAEKRALRAIAAAGGSASENTLVLRGVTRKTLDALVRAGKVISYHEGIVAHFALPIDAGRP